MGVIVCNFNWIDETFTSTLKAVIIVESSHLITNFKMMDITSLFKASVKTVRTRNKALGLNKHCTEDPNRILHRSSTRESKFQTRAKNLLSTLVKLKEFLVENRSAYLDAHSILDQKRKLSMTDRIEFDSATQLIIKNSAQNLNDLKKENDNLVANPQTIEHRQVVLYIIEQYFKSVCKVYQELKEIYSKRQQDFLKNSKMEGDGSHLRKSSFGPNLLSESPSEGTRTYPYDEDLEKSEEETVHLSGAEIQLFQKENSLLFNEINCLNEEVNSIQGRVSKIAELQLTLTENVLEQGKDIERINITSVATTESVREGNEQLRQAMQSNSGFRIGIIFFILVLTFSVLFLDWYNN